MNFKKLLFFIPVIAGVVFFILMMKNKQEPSRPELTEVSRAVKVVKVRSMSISPRVFGYGYVQPTEKWEAIPEVGGKVVEIHPELKKGSFVAEGELLVKIDTQSYGLAESRGEASVLSVEAQLKELEQQKINTEKLLEIEKQALKLSQKELERKQTLFSKGYLSASELDQEEKLVLSQQSSVDNLLNTLKLIPSQEKALIAQKQSDISSLSESRLNIEKTAIRAPFDCRISEVNIEQDQYAPAGVALLSAVNISAVEIPVQLSPRAFLSLLSTPNRNVSDFLDHNFDMDKIRGLIGLSAKVRLPAGKQEIEWDGVFRRTGEAMDLSTGAISVYIAVNDPYDKVIPGLRPPLIPNMYTEVELKGRVKTNRIVLPVQAVHDGYVYAVNGDNRLSRKKVEVEFVMGNMAVISQGLEENINIVITDLVPAIEGMLLKPEVDEEMTSKINALDEAK